MRADVGRPWPTKVEYSQSARTVGLSVVGPRRAVLLYVVEPLWCPRSCFISSSGMVLITPHDTPVCIEPETACCVLTSRQTPVNVVSAEEPRLLSHALAFFFFFLARLTAPHSAFAFAWFNPRLCLFLSFFFFSFWCWGYQELLDLLEAQVDAKGLDALMPGAFIANYARPRRFEVRPLHDDCWKWCAGWLPWLRSKTSFTCTFGWLVFRTRY